MLTRIFCATSPESQSDPSRISQGGGRGNTTLPPPPMRRKTSHAKGAGKRSARYTSSTTPARVPGLDTDDLSWVLSVRTFSVDSSTSSSEDPPRACRPASVWNGSIPARSPPMHGASQVIGTSRNLPALKQASWRSFPVLNVLPTSSTLKSERNFVSRGFEDSSGRQPPTHACPSAFSTPSPCIPAKASSESPGHPPVLSHQQVVRSLDLVVQRPSLPLVANSLQPPESSLHLRLPAYPSASRKDVVRPFVGFACEKVPRALAMEPPLSMKRSGPHVLASPCPVPDRELTTTREVSATPATQAASGERDRGSPPARSQAPAWQSLDRLNKAPPCQTARQPSPFSLPPQRARVLQTTPHTVIASRTHEVSGGSTVGQNNASCPCLRPRSISTCGTDSAPQPCLRHLTSSTPFLPSQTTTVWSGVAPSPRFPPTGLVPSQPAWCIPTTHTPTTRHLPPAWPCPAPAHDTRCASPSPTTRSTTPPLPHVTLLRSRTATDQTPIVPPPPSECNESEEAFSNARSVRGSVAAMSLVPAVRIAVPGSTQSQSPRTEVDDDLSSLVTDFSSPSQRLRKGKEDSRSGEAESAPRLESSSKLSKSVDSERSPLILLNESPESANVRSSSRKRERPPSSQRRASVSRRSSSNLHSHGSEVEAGKLKRRKTLSGSRKQRSDSTPHVISPEALVIESVDESGERKNSRDFSTQAESEVAADDTTEDDRSHAPSVQSGCDKASHPGGADEAGRADRPLPQPGSFYRPRRGLRTVASRARKVSRCYRRYLKCRRATLPRERPQVRNTDSFSDVGSEEDIVTDQDSAPESELTEKAGASSQPASPPSLPDSIFSHKCSPTGAPSSLANHRKSSVSEEVAGETSSESLQKGVAELAPEGSLLGSEIRKIQDPPPESEKMSVVKVVERGPPAEAVLTRALGHEGIRNGVVGNNCVVPAGATVNKESPESALPQIPSLPFTSDIPVAHAHVIQLDVDDTLIPTTQLCEHDWLDKELDEIPETYREKMKLLDTQLTDLFDLLHHMVVHEDASSPQQQKQQQQQQQSHLLPPMKDERGGAGIPLSTAVAPAGVPPPPPVLAPLTLVFPSNECMNSTTKSETSDGIPPLNLPAVWKPLTTARSSIDAATRTKANTPRGVSKILPPLASYGSTNLQTDRSSSDTFQSSDSPCSMAGGHSQALPTFASALTSDLPPDGSSKVSRSSQHYLLSVVIVTNATMSHIKTVFPRFLPIFTSFLERKQIHIDDLVCSARDLWSDEFPYEHFYDFWKCWTLEDVLTQLRQDGVRQLTVLSIGDDEPERRAAAYVRQELPDLVAGIKIVKMIPRPDISDILTQLKFLVKRLRYYIQAAASFDITLNLLVDESREKEARKADGTDARETAGLSTSENSRSTGAGRGASVVEKGQPTPPEPPNPFEAALIQFELKFVQFHRIFSRLQRPQCHHTMRRHAKSAPASIESDSRRDAGLPVQVQMTQSGSRMGGSPSVDLLDGIDFSFEMKAGRTGTREPTNFDGAPPATHCSLREQQLDIRPSHVHATPRDLNSFTSLHLNRLMPFHSQDVLALEKDCASFYALLSSRNVSLSDLASSSSTHDSASTDESEGSSAALAAANAAAIATMTGGGVVRSPQDEGDGSDTPGSPHSPYMSPIEESSGIFVGLVHNVVRFLLLYPTMFLEFTERDHQVLTILVVRSILSVMASMRGTDLSTTKGAAKSRAIAAPAVYRGGGQQRSDGECPHEAEASGAASTALTGGTPVSLTATTVSTLTTSVTAPPVSKVSAEIEETSDEDDESSEGAGHHAGDETEVSPSAGPLSAFGSMMRDSLLAGPSPPQAIGCSLLPPVPTPPENQQQISASKCDSLQMLDHVTLQELEHTPNLIETPIKHPLPSVVSAGDGVMYEKCDSTLTPMAAFSTPDFLRA